MKLWTQVKFVALGKTINNEKQIFLHLNGAFT